MREEKIKLDKIELNKIKNILQDANIPPKQLPSIISKLKKVKSALIKKENLSKLIHLIVMEPRFRVKFIKTSIKNLPLLMVEFGIVTKLKFEQFKRQADSPESYGQDSPIIAVDPSGKWVAQAGRVNTSCEYGLEIYELNKDKISYSKLIKISIPGEIVRVTGNNKIKYLCFSKGGKYLWASLGTNPSNGPFKTWIIRIHLKDWNYDVFGPIAPYNYYNDTFSKIHFLNFNTFYIDGIEKLIAPSKFNRNTLVIFNPEEPYKIETWVVNLKNDQDLQIYIRFTDLFIQDDLVYLAGWIEKLTNTIPNNPHATFMVLNLNTRNIVFRPLEVPEMLGYFNLNNKIIWPLKLRMHMNGKGVYLIAEKLAPKETGGLFPDRSGFASIEFESKKVILRDSYTTQTNNLRLQEVRDVISFGFDTYMLIFQRDLHYNSYNLITKLNDELYQTKEERKVPEDWWPYVFVEKHPRRISDLIVSAVRNIYHPIYPTGQISLWETY